MIKNNKRSNTQDMQTTDPNNRIDTTITTTNASSPGTSITLQEAQAQVDHWINTVGVRYFNELTNLGILVEEVGELSRLMVRQFGEQSFKQKEVHLNTKEALADELADVLWVLLCLANQTGVDLSKALQQNFDKKTGRDQERHKNNPQLRT